VRAEDGLVDDEGSDGCVGENVGRSGGE